MACDKTAYTENQIKAVLASLAAAMAPHGGVKLVLKAYAVIGVVRLLRNAYLILVTHRNKVGTIAGHRVYGCRDVAYLPVISKEYLQQQEHERPPPVAPAAAPFNPPTATIEALQSADRRMAPTSKPPGIAMADGAAPMERLPPAVAAAYSRSNSFSSGGSRLLNGPTALFQDMNLTKSIKADEKRYLRLFMGVDLCKDFFFSYTYPLWNTLQQNLLLGEGQENPR